MAGAGAAMGGLAQRFKNQQAQQAAQQANQNIILQALAAGATPQQLQALGMGPTMQGASTTAPTPSGVMPPPTTVPQQGGGPVTRRGGMQQLPTRQPAQPSPLARLQQPQTKQLSTQASTGQAPTQPTQAPPQGVSGFLGRPLVPPQGFVSYEDLVSTVAPTVDIVTDGTPGGRRVTIGGGKIEFLDPITTVIDGQIVEVSVARDVNSGEEAIHSIVPAKETIEARQILSNASGLPINDPLITFQAPLFNQQSPQEQTETLEQMQAGNVDVLIPSNNVIHVPRGSSPQVPSASSQTGAQTFQRGVPVQEQRGATVQIPGIGDVPVGRITDVASQIIQERGGKAPAGPELERMVTERLQQEGQAGQQPTTVQPTQPESTQAPEAQGMRAVRKAVEDREMEQLLRKETQQIVARRWGEISKDMARTHLTLPKLGNVIDAMSKVRWPSGTFKSTVRRMIAGSGILDTILTSFEEMGPDTVGKMLSGFDPLTKEEIATLSGVTQEERDAIAALHILLADLRGFSNEARPTDFDAMRSLKALGQEWGASPARQINQMVVTFNTLVDQYNTQGAGIRKNAPHLLDALGLPEILEHRRTPPGFRARSQDAPRPKRTSERGGVLPKLREGGSTLPGRHVNPNEIAQ